MNDWITIGEGKYMAQAAYLMSPANKAVALENAYIEVYTGPGARRLMRGLSFVRNILIVLLLEDSDDLDILLDLGPSHKYHLVQPEIKAGKVFSPDVKSRLQFVPSAPWQPMSDDEYQSFIERLQIIDT